MPSVLIDEAVEVVAAGEGASPVGQSRFPNSDRKSLSIQPESRADKLGHERRLPQVSLESQVHSFILLFRLFGSPPG